MKLVYALSVAQYMKHVNAKYKLLHFIVFCLNIFLQFNYTVLPLYYHC
jgi:hypothetical protein